jgi:hypothetical protein
VAERVLSFCSIDTEGPQAPIEGTTGDGGTLYLASALPEPSFLTEIRVEVRNVECMD